MDVLPANRAFWDGLHAADAEYADQLGYGRRQWAAEPNWGDWSLPESDLRLLPADLTGRDTVELGCGTAYLSAWLARRGARPIAVDTSRRQLSIARQLQGEFGLAFPLLLADGAAVPCKGASFDLVVSEYGACSWADPYRWVPEAARLLRPGGRLLFLAGTPILLLCLPDDGSPAGITLRRDYFGMHAIYWADRGTTDFQLPYGEWIRLLRRAGFVIEDLVELQPPAGAHSPWPYVDDDWARRWPAEQVWVATRA